MCSVVLDAPVDGTDSSTVSQASESRLVCVTTVDFSSLQGKCEHERGYEHVGVYGVSILVCAQTVQADSCFKMSAEP